MSETKNAYIQLNIVTALIAVIRDYYQRINAHLVVMKANIFILNWNIESQTDRAKN